MGSLRKISLGSLLFAVQARRFVGGLWKQVVRYAHFYVVGFSCENHDRFILRLPAKASNGAVVAAAIRHALYAQFLANLLGGFVTAQNLYVLNPVQNSQSVQLQGNAKAYIAAAVFRFKINWR